jgi:hypothetical protein
VNARGGSSGPGVVGESSDSPSSTPEEVFLQGLTSSLDRLGLRSMCPSSPLARSHKQMHSDEHSIHAHRK